MKLENAEVQERLASRLASDFELDRPIKADRGDPFCIQVSDEGVLSCHACYLEIGGAPTTSGKLRKKDKQGAPAGRERGGRRGFPQERSRKGRTVRSFSCLDFAV